MEKKGFAMIVSGEQE